MQPRLSWIHTALLFVIPFTILFVLFPQTARGAGSEVVCPPVASEKSILQSGDLEVELPDDTTICLGDSVSLGPVKIDDGVPPYTYYWWPSGTLNNNNSPSPTAVPVATTTYYLFLVDSTGATALDSMVVTVDSNCCNSKANFVFQSQDYCTGSSVYFLNASQASGNATYQWHFGNTASISTWPGPNPPPVSFGAAGPNFVYLVLADSCGQDTVLKKVEILQGPVVAAIRDTFACENDSVLIGAANVPGYQFHWSPPAGLANPDSAQTQAQPAATTMYFLLVTDTANGCSHLDSMEVKPFPAPVVNLGNDTAVCEGQGLLLNAGNSGASYLWCDGSTSQGVQVTNSGLQCVTATFGNGCADADSVMVTIHPNPVIDLGPDTSYCNGDSFFLDAGPGFVSYSWSNVKFSQKILVTQPGTYWVAAVDSNGCIGRDTIQVNVLPLPGALFLYTPNYLTVSFLDLSAPNVTSWNWDFGDGNTSTVKNPQHTYTTAGIYYVCLHAINDVGCEEVFCDSISVTGMGLSESMKRAAVQVYPNPSAGAFRVRIRGGRGVDGHAALYRATGEIVYERDFLLFAGKGTFDIIAEGLQTGVYFLKVEWEEGVVMRNIAIR